MATRYEGALWGAGLLLATGAVYAGVLGHNFVPWDDDIEVYGNPYLDPVTFHGVLQFWRTPYQDLFVPVTYSSYALLALLSHWAAPASPGMALNAHLFHAANLILHAANVLLVFVLVRSLVGRSAPAAAGALLFAIHPVQVEPVAWVGELKGVLSAFFSLLALRQYLAYARASRDAAADPRVRRRLYVLASALFVLALLSKPSAVAVPLVAWVLDRWGLGRPVGACTRSLLPWAGLAVLWVALARGAQPVPPGTGGPLWGRPFVAGDALAFYLSKLVWPVRLAIDYGRTPAWVLAHRWGYLSGLVPLALGIAAWRVRSRFPLLLAAGAIFVAALLPVLGLVPFIFQLHSTVSDRYLYLAMLGPALALAWALSARPGLWSSALCMAVLSLLGLQSTLQTEYWRNGQSLFAHALEVNPRSWAAHADLGALLGMQGDLPRAAAEMGDAIRLNPGDGKARSNLGTLLLQEGRTAEAVSQFREAVRDNPVDAATRYNLGLALSRQGRFAEATGQFRQALDISPGLPRVVDALRAVERGRPPP